jgi:chitinase
VMSLLVASATMTSAAMAGPVPNGFKSVGYMPSWAGDVNKVQYGKLTHINYAFVMPDANGKLPGPPNPTKLRSLVRLGHANGVKVLISIGGWNNGDDAPFESLAAKPATRTAFVNNTLKMVAAYNLDGTDIDWEYPNPGASAGNFTKLMAELGAALHAKGKLLTAAVISNGNTQGVQPAVFGHVDFLNIMLYDGGNPHANYDWAINYVNQWKARGLPTGKAVVGIPFYSRPTYASYAQLVDTDPANANRDCTTVNGGQACYNGRPTVARKTQWALANAGGMMHWELSNDTSDATSLVNVIHENALGTRSGEITGASGKCVDVRTSRTANGTPIQLYGCNGTNAQWWTLDGTGAIRALGKCLDVPGGSTANGALVQLWDCNGTGAQAWQARPDGTLRNPQSGKCLDAVGFGTADGTRLQIWDCSGGSNQQWRTATWAGGARAGQITGTSGKCVDVRTSQTANGTPIQLYGCNGSNAQWWTLDGTGAIRALGKCLDVPGSSTANGAQLQLWDCNGTGAQKWRARADGTLLNPHSNKCLDAAGFGTADGTRLQIWDCHGGSNQVWRLP